MSTTSLKRAVDRLVAAEVAYSWKGAAAASEVPAIEKEREAARSAFRLQCATLERKLKEKK